MHRVSGPGAFLAATLLSASLLAQPVPADPAPPSDAPPPPPAPPAAAYPSEPSPGEPPAAPPGEAPPPAIAPAPAQPPPTGQPPATGQPPPAYPPPPPGYGYPSYEPPPPEESKAVPRDVSITLSPLYLLLPLLEGQVEARIYPHFSLKVIAGYGSITVKDIDPDIDGTVLDVVEVGGQVTAYPLEDFQSMQLGVDLMWTRVSGENLGDTGLLVIVDGVGLGPFLGYKALTRVGFTFVIQGGFRYALMKGEASDNAGNSESAEDGAFGPLLNANLGWSF